MRSSPLTPIYGISERSSWAVWAWAGLSAGTFLAVGVATLFLVIGIESLVLVPAGVEAGAGSFAHGAVLASHVALWALISGSVTVIGARMFLGAGFAPIDRLTQLLFAIGIVVAAGVQLALHEYGRARFGFFDPRELGVTSLLPLAVVAVTTAWIGILVSRARLAIPWAIFGLSSLSVLGILALNLAGLRDGVEATSLPLALAMGLAGLVGLAYWLVALNVWRRPRASVSTRG